MENKTNKTEQIAVAAVCTILSFLCYVIASYIGITGKFTLMVIASMCMCAIVITDGVKVAIGSYLIVAFLSFAIGNVNMTQILYVVVFALYPLLKSVLERDQVTIRIFLLKALVFAVMAFLVILIKQIYSFKLYLYLIVLIIGFGYDYLLGVGIFIYSFFRAKIKGLDPMEMFEEDEEPEPFLGEENDDVIENDKE